MKISSIICGAQKSATTSLFQYLSKASDISSHEQREMNFFLDDESFEKGISSMMSTYYPNHNSGNHILAKHAMLCYSLKALKRLKNHNENVKLILVIRDPIDRAYSAYWYARRRGWESIKSFFQAIDEEPKRIAKNGWEASRNNAYVNNSKYGDCLLNMLKYFDGNRLLIVDQQSIRERPQEVIQSTCKFLVIDSDFVFEGTKHNKASMAKSEGLSKLMAKISDPKNPIKKIIKFIVPINSLYKLRYAIMKLNERPDAPPPLSKEDREKMAILFKEDQALLNQLILKNNIKVL